MTASQRRAMARKARMLLQRTGVSNAVLAELAGISYGTLRVALSDRSAHRTATLEESVPALAAAMDGLAVELRTVAAELRALAQTSE